MLKFVEVTKEYPDGTVALSDVNLKVSPGEFVFVVGPSGAGKSTMLKLIIREECPTAGEIFFEDVEITTLPRKYLPTLRREVGVVFQDFKLLPQRTVFENVALSLEVVGKTAAEVYEVVPGVLDLVGLEHKIDQFPSNLSGGERQRLAIARALAHEPKLFIADEPTGMNDPATSLEIMELFNAISNLGTTVIVATHAAGLVDGLQKRVVALDNGQIVRDEKKGSYEDK